MAGIGGGGTLRDLKLIDVNGTPVVAYTNNQRKLFLKSWNGSSWVDAGGQWDAWSCGFVGRRSFRQ